MAKIVVVEYGLGMYAKLLTLVCLILIGCNSVSEKNSSTNKSEQADNVLVQTIMEERALGFYLKDDFIQRMRMEKAHWQQEFPKVLEGEQLQQGLTVLSNYQTTLEDAADYYSSDNVVGQRLNEYLSSHLSQQELAAVAQFISSQEWQKYQAALQQLSYNPDALGLHAEFMQNMKLEREKMVGSLATD